MTILLDIIQLGLFYTEANGDCKLLELHCMLRVCYTTLLCLCYFLVAEAGRTLQFSQGYPPHCVCVCVCVCVFSFSL